MIVQETLVPVDLFIQVMLVKFEVMLLQVNQHIPVIQFINLFCQPVYPSNVTPSKPVSSSNASVSKTARSSKVYSSKPVCSSNICLSKTVSLSNICLSKPASATIVFSSKHVGLMNVCPSKPVRSSNVCPRKPVSPINDCQSKPVSPVNVYLQNPSFVIKTLLFKLFLVLLLLSTYFKLSIVTLRIFLTNFTCLRKCLIFFISLYGSYLRSMLDTVMIF